MRLLLGPAAFLLASCAPGGAEDVATAARFQVQAVCMAYDDLRGRGVPVDSTDAARREIHQQAMDVCDELGVLLSGEFG